MNQSRARQQADCEARNGNHSLTVAALIHSENLNVTATSSTAGIEQISPDEWDAFVESHIHGSVYHYSSWHRVIEKTYGYPACYHVIKEQNEIRAGLPLAEVKNLVMGRRLVAFPFSDYCDPLVRHPDDFKCLLDSVKMKAQKLKIRNFELRAYKASDLAGQGADSSGYCTFTLSLARPPHQLFREFHKSCVQRSIKKAERNQVSVVEGKTIDDLRAFFRLHVLNRKRLGVPVQPFRFFKNLCEEFSRPNQLTLLLAKRSNTTLAGLILLGFKKTAYYKFGASDPRFRALCPNHLLFWTAIQHAFAEGRELFDFGRTSTSDTGLMTFKKRWGASPEQLVYLSSSSNGNSFESIENSSMVKISRRLLSSLPSCFTRFSGELLYRYLA